LIVLRRSFTSRGYYYFKQGKPREKVKTVWHGDQTPDEIYFANRTRGDAFLWLTSARNNSAELLPVQTYGHLVYEACINCKPL
jgi:phage terminase large subunit-like protein